VFDPLKHGFNPLRNIDRKKARELSDVIYTASPQDENTLTVRNGRRALAPALAEAKRLDEVRVESPIKGVNEEVEEMLGELLFTETMWGVLCSGNDFAFMGWEGTPKCLPGSIAPSWGSLMRWCWGCS
jgi:hypothetical protein